MRRNLGAYAALAPLLLSLCITGSAFAQKRGGILRVAHFDSPPSMSLLEESTIAADRPIMGVFNNLVVFDQHVAQNSMKSIVPDLALSWAWNEEGTELTMPLRHGVKWHDGKPFTSADVKCTWDLLTGKSKDHLRINPRKPWYENLAEVTTNGDYEVTFHLKRPEPSFLMLLATGWSPVYPCHVSAREMRRHPIGTGPFKFVSFKPNQSITVARNPDYWKKGRPYLDGIQYDIIKNMATRVLALIAGKDDFLPGVPFPMLKQIHSEAPNIICDEFTANVYRNLLVNRDKPPFNNADVRRAMSLALDRSAFIKTLYEGHGLVGGVMEPPPDGLWGLTPKMLEALPGYGPDIHKRRVEARKLMEKAGYGPNKRLHIKVSARNVVFYRDPAVLVIDQLKHIYIDGDLEPLETTQWYPKLMRKDYTVALNITESEVDDPDAQFYENFTCGAARNYTKYCNKEVDELIDEQSRESDVKKRQQIVWEIQKKLIEDNARPVLFYPKGEYCRQPAFKGFVTMVNSIYNNWRFEDAWLDR
jgi:peptide/nickel transport system substrate-binding protein